MKFCPKCGNEVKIDAKFCGKCGEAFKLVNQATATQATQPQPLQTSTSTKPRFDIKAKGMQIVTQLQQSGKKEKIIRVLVVLAAVGFIFFGWRYFTQRDYRQAMDTAESYFEQGKYGDALKFYQQAHDYKPGDEKVIEMGQHAEDLGNYWYSINEDDYLEDELALAEELDAKVESLEVENPSIQEKYQEAADTLKETSGYRLRKSISDRY